MIIPSDLQSEEADISRRLTLGEPVRHYETRRVGKDGRAISVCITASALKDASGTIIGISKVVRNITERKLAEEALSSISRKLLGAHEEERTRIARELHDDIIQRIALVAMQLQRMQKVISSSAPELHKQIADAHEQLSDVTKDVQSLSHRLHSSKLEYLGLVAASKSFLAEVSERGRVEIHFHSQDVPKTISQEVAVCLFRVLQEAVHNAIKHSCSRDIRVSLTTGEEAVELEVDDSGTGFDLEEAMKGRGLGLISMKERLKLVGGDFVIQSRLKEGTTIHVRVPRT
jgi:signal transduction histidine kinase